VLEDCHMLDIRGLRNVIRNSSTTSIVYYTAQDCFWGVTLDLHWGFLCRPSYALCDGLIGKTEPTVESTKQPLLKHWLNRMRMLV